MPLTIGMACGGLEYELRLGFSSGRIDPLAGECLFLPERSLPLVDRKLGGDKASFRPPTGTPPTLTRLRDTKQLALGRYLQEHELVPGGARLDQLLRGIRFYHARDFVLGSLRWQGSPATPDTVLDAKGANLWAVLRNLHALSESDQRFRTIQEYMRKALPRFDRVEAVPAGPASVYARFFEEDRRNPTDASGIADGDLQLLLLLTALFAEPEDRPCVLLFDEPDISLHPWALHVLAQAMTEAANSWNRQILMATHSPVLMSQFEPEAILMAERIEGAAQIRRLSEVAEVQDILSQYAVGSLYMSELIARQSSPEGTTP
jgi:predicted ATPase